MTPIPSAQNLPVGLIDASDGSTGFASAIVQLNIGSLASNSFQIAVGVTGAYTNNPAASLSLAIVTVSKPVTGGFITGGGCVPNTNAAGLIRGASDQNTGYQFDIQYTKSGTNPKGKVRIMVKSYYTRDGLLDNKLHTYFITTNAISLLNIGTPLATGTFSAKANLVEQLEDLSTVTIESGATFQMTAFQNACNQRIAITLHRKAGGIWFASNWNAASSRSDLLAVTSKSRVHVAGGGNCSAATSSRTTYTPELQEVNWNTSNEDLLKELDQMSKGWFEGSSVAMRWNLDAFDGRTPGFYQVVGEPVSGNLSDLQNMVEIPVLVREKPLATDILASVKVIPSNVEVGQVFTKLITVDKADDIHTYQVSENDYFDLVDDQLVWKSAAVPAELRLTVTSTDRAGQSIERELVFRKGAGNNGNFDIPAASSVSEVIVHPNPAREQFANVQVRLSQAAKVNLRVYDPQGRLVYQDEAYEENSFMRTLDLKGYSNGLYMILVQVDNQLITKRLIKE
jgi:hypothetical protein